MTNRLISLIFLATCIFLFTGKASVAQNAMLNLHWDLHVTTDPNAKVAADATSKALASALWVMGGSVNVGTLEETLTYPKPGQYRIKSDIHGGKVLETVWSNAHDLRFSQGQLGPARLLTERFYDKRGDREALQAGIDLAKKRIEYFDGNRSVKIEPLKGEATDLVALPYLFLGRPLPVKPFTVWLVDGKGSREITFDVAAAPVVAAAVTVDAVKLTARRPKPDDASIEIWIRKSDAVPVHVRIGMNAKYGVVLEENLQAIPPAYVTPAAPESAVPPAAGKPKKKV